MSELPAARGSGEEGREGQADVPPTVRDEPEAPSTDDAAVKQHNGENSSAAPEHQEEERAAASEAPEVAAGSDGLNGGARQDGAPKGLLPSAIEIPVKPSRTIDEVMASHGPDSPTTSLIASLRDQLSILSDQTSELNSKLVTAISRHADLEDAHLNLKTSHSELQEKAAELSVEKAKWEESMNTGLLVERSQIKDEMQKLAAGLVEEERRRGSAEERRQKVEEEVDELAASLFDQANTMVAAERMARNEAETRLKSTEDNLAAAESAMRDMQLHLQSLPAASSSSPPAGSNSIVPRRYLASHLPYTEFLLFLAHLRSLRPLKDTSKAIFPPPPISNLLAQPFIARAVTEDHDPTIRLDAAPDLSYFSRRNVGPAIIAGELIIEPVSASTVISATTAPPHDINCTLCGKPVFPSTVPQSPSASHFGPPPLHPAQSKSRFSLKPFFNTTSPSTGSTTASPGQSPLASPSPAQHSASFGSVYVFRVNKAAPTTGSSEKETKVYPLCRTGWCLERLRAACELWHFVKVGIIHPVWHGDDGYVLQAEQAIRDKDDATPTPASDRRVSSGSTSNNRLSGGVAAPPLPERKKSGGWGLGFKLGSGERSPSSSGFAGGSGAGGGGGGWFGRSASATPPRSPVTPNPPDLPERPGDADGQNGLDAPIDLDSPAKPKTDDTTDDATAIDTDRSDVPRINQVDASPAAHEKTEDKVEGDETKEGDTLRPVVSRTGSLRSVTTSNGGTDEATFSTPKGQASDLPEGESASASPKETEDQGEQPPSSTDEAKVVDLSESSNNSPVPPAQPTAPAPPPIPRRAANRMSAQPSPTPPVNAPSADAGKPVDQPDAVKEDVELNDAPPPPLPARHPVTPTAVEIKEAVPEGEKRWLRTDGDAWEDKTWKMVVKLKEGMWKARIGVSDELE